MTLYCEKVFPKIRLENDKNFFLDQCIEDLLFKIEDLMHSDIKDLQQMKKQKEKLEKINEFYKDFEKNEVVDYEVIKNEQPDQDELRKMGISNYPLRKYKMCPEIYKRKNYDLDMPIS